MVEVTQVLAKLIQSGNLEFASEDTKILHEFDVARLYLTSATWMHGRYTGDTLRTHEINLLYKHRDELRTLPAEALQLFRATLADTSAVVPGWFWFKKMDADALRGALLTTSTRDSSEEVRKRALQLLNAAKIKLPKKIWNLLPFDDRGQTVRIEAYKYLGSIADESVLDQLDTVASRDDNTVTAIARKARLKILMRGRPTETVAKLITSGEYLADEQVSKIEPLIANIPDQELLLGLKNPSDSIRRLCVKQLGARHVLKEDTLKNLITDSSILVRQQAYIELAKIASNLDFEKVRESLAPNPAHQKPFLWGLAGNTEPEINPDSVISEFYKHQNVEMLNEAIDWFSIDGELPYHSLAMNHFNDVSDSLRSDLDDDFSSVRNRSIEKLKIQYAIPAVDEVLKSFVKVESYVRSKFAAAALSALALHGQVEDVRFGRKHLNTAYDFEKLAAVRVVSKFGDKQDVDQLLKIAKDAWGDLSDEAGLAALKLSDNPFETAKALIKTRNDKLIRAGFKWLYAQKGDDIQEFFENLLNSESDSDRVRSVFYFSKILDKKRLTKLLKAQFVKNTYYYNVVTWLDRLLYSPRLLHRYFVQELERQAEG